MTYERLRLTYVDGSLDYLIRNIQGVDPVQEKSAFSISPPGVPPESNILLGTQGQTREYTVRFKPFDNGADTADGTYTESVESVHEQYEYLTQEIHVADSLAEYQLNHDTGSLFPNEQVYVERMSLPVLQVDAPLFPEWSMTIRVGGSA